MEQIEQTRFQISEAQTYPKLPRSIEHTRDAPALVGWRELRPRFRPQHRAGRHFIVQHLVAAVAAPRVLPPRLRLREIEVDLPFVAHRSARYCPSSRRASSYATFSSAMSVSLPPASGCR